MAPWQQRRKKIANCKSQIANCKLKTAGPCVIRQLLRRSGIRQNAEATGPRGILANSATESIRSDMGLLGQFSICILQFAFCNSRSSEIGPIALLVAGVVEEVVQFGACQHL